MRGSRGWMGSRQRGGGDDGGHDLRYGVADEVPGDGDRGDAVGGAGKVDVDAPVVTYLPEFGANGKEKVTVRELLTHYSGLPPDVV